MRTEAAPPVVAKRFGYALKRAQHALRIAMDEVLRPLSLTTPQYSVLSALEVEPGLSNARLARSAFVTPQTMHGLLTLLERECLVIRHADPDHGRILRTQITEAGRAKLKAAHLEIATVEQMMVEALDAAHAGHMTDALTNCAEALSQRRSEDRATTETASYRRRSSSPQAAA